MTARPRQRQPLQAVQDRATQAFHRVDAARRLMHDPRRAREALGRLYFAKRVHEAAKRGEADLDVILEEVLASIDDEVARDGARREHAFFRQAPS